MTSWRVRVLWVVALGPLVFIATPILKLFSSLTWQQSLSIWTSPTFLEPLSVSCGAALLTTLIATVFGVPLAFGLARRQFPGKALVELLLLLPLLLPPVVDGIAQINVYGPNTGIGQWADALGIPLTDSFTGVILAQSLVTAPFLILAAQAGFERVPPGLGEVVRLEGGDAWVEFWYIALPLSRHAIAIGMALTFARAIGEFGATMILAYHPYTVPVALWVAFSSGGLKDILPMAAGLVVIGAVTVGAWSVYSTTFGQRTARKQRLGASGEKPS